MLTAVDDELIRRNPCRIKGAGKENAAGRRTATVAQVDAFAEAVGVRWRLRPCLGAYGPMPPEEPAGLRRLDTGLDTLRIRVRPAEPERRNGRRVQRTRSLHAPMRPHMSARDGHGAYGIPIRPRHGLLVLPVGLTA